MLMAGYMTIVGLNECSFTPKAGGTRRLILAAMLCLMLGLVLHTFSLCFSLIPECFFWDEVYFLGLIPICLESLFVLFYCRKVARCLGDEKLAKQLTYFFISSFVVPGNLLGGLAIIVGLTIGATLGRANFEFRILICTAVVVALAWQGWFVCLMDRLQKLLRRSTRSHR